jgi:signal transduction histidine kinase/HAMP domain-containing protein
MAFIGKDFPGMKILSLKAKFTILAILISLISFSVAAFFSTQWVAEEIENDYKDKAELMGTHIIHTIGTAMISKIHGGITTVVDLYRNYRDVEEVRVFNQKGVEILSGEAGLPEPKVEEALATGQSIHFHKKLNKREVLSYIIPIANKPECHVCHGASQSLRGVLLLSLNQEHVKQYVGQQKVKFFILFGLIAIVVGIATLILVNRLFFKPLSLIQKGTEAIKGGNFEYQIPVSSKDEIGILTENFNHMAGTLRSNNDELWEQLRLISRSQKEWQETFDSITDLICIIDKDFNIIKANRAFHLYNSISPHVEIDRKCYEFLGTCIRPNCPHVFSMGGKRYVHNEIRDEKTGKMLDVSYFPYYSPQGELTGTIFIAKDVTEKKESEMRLIANERLAALGEMASGVAHELNNPLATIAVCTEGLLNRMEKKKIDPLLFENYLGMIDEETQRCKKITESMLSFVRETKKDRKEIDIHEVLNKTIEMINFQGRLKDVLVLRHFQQGLPMVLGNEWELMQVFTSIIVNALDAMEDKGTLTFETGTLAPSTSLEKLSPPAPFFEKATLPSPPLAKAVPPSPPLVKGGEGGFIFVKISDTGPGIGPGLINRVFDPFFTTKSEKGGTGLGLSIAHNILKENNGRIEVKSEEGKGATFMISLPT